MLSVWAAVLRGGVAGSVPGAEERLGDGTELVTIAAGGGCIWNGDAGVNGGVVGRGAAVGLLGCGRGAAAATAAG